MRRPARGLAQLTGAGLAAVLTVALAQGPAAGAFAAQTGNPGSTARAATSFCVSPGPQDVPITNDAWTDEADAATAHGTTPALQVGSGVGTGRRSYLRFSLPAAPKHCELSAAQLRLRAAAPVGGATIDVQRADPAQNPVWAAGTLTWANQPTAVGTPVGSASLTSAGTQTWDVTAHTVLLYAGVNNGFVLKDRAEGTNPVRQQAYDEQSTAGGTPPVLRLTWG